MRDYGQLPAGPFGLSASGAFSSNSKVPDDSMFYNFVRVHQTLKTTQAKAAGVTTRVWRLEDAVDMIDAWDAREARQMPASRLKGIKILRNFMMRVDVVYTNAI